MEPTIDPIDPKLIKKELTKSRFMRPTNKAHNEIYVVDSKNSPNVMKEIGRLRELSFRSWGGGTGKKIDTDIYDDLQKPYKQLIVWNPDDEEIIGGYRFLLGKDAEFDQNGQPILTMGHLFIFSDTFIKEFLPYSIELGRAFVQPHYQSSKMGMKSLFALDNLWDGLGALIHQSKGMKYFIGKVTIYDNYTPEARDLIYGYMEEFCPDPEKLIRPKVAYEISAENRKKINVTFNGRDSEANYKILQKIVRENNETVPPLINAYIGLTNTMRTFGTMYDPTFGNVFETGIMITIADLLDTKQKRYIEPYVQYMKMMLAERRKRRQELKAKKAEAIERAERVRKNRLRGKKG